MMSSARAVLLDRIQQYEKAGWLEDTAASYYSQMIQRDPSLCQKVSQDLQRAAALAAEKTIRNKKHDSGNQHDSVLVTKSSFHHKQEDEKKKDSVILEPFDLKIDDAALKDLFVEMCFFARLGFVQPPCCLHCAHRETMMQKTTTAADNSDAMGVDENCSNWVIWRKDGSVFLHPDHIGDNMIVVQCSAARKLLQGKEVEGRVWVHERKQVVIVKKRYSS